MANELFNRLKSPTPAFFKKVIRISLVLSAGAAALLMAETLGKAVIPTFTFKLAPYVELICKNIFVAGIVAAAVSKFAKDDGEQSPYSAPKDSEINKN